MFTMAITTTRTSMLRDMLPLDQADADTEDGPIITVRVKAQRFGLSTSPAYSVSETVFLPEDVPPALFRLLRQTLLEGFGPDLAAEVPIQRPDRSGEPRPGWEATEDRFLASCRTLFREKRILVDWVTIPPA
jgi:hypothetical protein